MATLNDDYLKIIEKKMLPGEGLQLYLFVRRDGGWEAAASPTTIVALNAQAGIAYTLVLADKDRSIGVNNAAANTVTIPTNAAAAFAIGTQITVRPRGAGKTAITGASLEATNGILPEM